MQYIIVKKNNSPGSYLYGSEDSKEIEILESFFNHKLKGQDKEILLLPNIEMCKEYEPFIIPKTVGEFMDKAVLF